MSAVPMEIHASSRSRHGILRFWHVPSHIQGGLEEMMIYAFLLSYTMHYVDM